MRSSPNVKIIEATAEFLEKHMLGRIALALGLSVCVPALAEAQDYLLRSGDVVEVTVQEDENLNRRVMIRPDGKVSLPLSGTLSAAGGTPEALQREITRRLKESFVADPTVTVSLVALAEEPESALTDNEALLPSVYVIGEVANPGRYEFNDKVNVLQALSLAGGLGVFAAKDRIQVRRHVNQSEVVEIFDYSVIEDGELAVAEIPLSDGDVIVVPERGLFE